MNVGISKVIIDTVFIPYSNIIKLIIQNYAFKILQFYLYNFQNVIQKLKFKVKIIQVLHYTELLVYI